MILRDFFSEFQVNSLHSAVIASSAKQKTPCLVQHIHLFSIKFNQDQQQGQDQDRWAGLRARKPGAPIPWIFLSNLILVQFTHPP